MKTFKIVMVVLSIIWMSFVSTSTIATEKDVFATTLTTNQGQRWRIGYYEGGEYSDYQQYFIAIVRSLMKRGWIEPVEIPPQEGEQTVQLWQWLSTNLKSDYIEFVADAHYSAGWDEKQRTKMAQKIINRFNQRNDIDLMIAMGTWAGKGLANDKHQVATMVVSSTDPLAAGIIKSVEDSGYDNVHAAIDPNLHQRQLRVFHDLVGFKRLGVAYENTVEGRSYAAMDVIEEQAQERKFKINSCYTQSDISDVRVAELSVIECFRDLAQKVDAIYVTPQGGLTQSSLPILVRIANKFKIPTFSLIGSEEVKYGVLMSLSKAGLRYIGDFHAQTFAQVFNGARPNQLHQLFESPPKMALNLETASRIGFNPPLLLLGAADEMYREILSEQ